jgi:hypothetical protein
MSEELSKTLRRKLRLRAGATDILNNREGTELEFKTTFSLGSMAKYCRTMIAFANNRGGFMVFGVEPRPHRLKGIDADRFDATDPAEISNFLKEHSSPEIEWDMGIATVHGVDLGYLYTYEAAVGPVMSVRDKGKDLKQAEIYYRYRGQSSVIRYSEMRSLLDAQIKRERDAWMAHLARISEAGPTNVAVLNSVSGELHGVQSTYILDEELLRKVRFVEQGRFVESKGEPTLRLVGDVLTSSGPILERPVGVGIHSDDLIRSFLAQRRLTASEARNYLVEAVHQNSPLVPIFYYARLAGLSNEQAAEVLEAEMASNRGVQRRVLARLRGHEQFEPIGPGLTVPDSAPTDTAELLTAVSGRRPADARGVLATALRSNPSIVEGGAQEVPVNRLAEAITQLAAEEISDRRDGVLGTLLATYETRFHGLESIDRSWLRKAIGYVDQSLYRDMDGQPNEGAADGPKASASPPALGR